MNWTLHNDPRLWEVDNSYIGSGISEEESLRWSRVGAGELGVWKTVLINVLV